MAATDSDRLPWCDACECFAVPTEDDGVCGDCGGEVTLVTTPP